MGACSVNIPTIVVSGGPMLTGNYKGKSIGTSDVWRYHDDTRRQSAGRRIDYD
jgi:dihydroxy-acid dehydratase